ncbi:hypothetical protein GPECTOR_15g282 [Gonium pectorale]|uniref:Uncharacterized protein n=1 Tax=Gonium pectorale TaxID=33097 RepID=A0A150GL70_GONPE|nr:hypothetical protein GPECTOR_15g282 [Gonium pectorale]|eukprot:KXZ50599.1 hypothetical protein GPECTOR_15g282 [Gonium pectorale]
MKNYKLIFWSLRFHGKLFFNRLYVDVKRIWQPEDGVIKMRWTVHGIPRVPWEAEGTFDGISTYRLDSHGKIYEHSVDNILLRDPPMITNPPLLAGLNLQPLVPQQPVPGAWCQGADPEEQWGAAWMQRMVASALHSLEQEPEPAAAMAGLSAAAPLPLSHQQHQQLALPGAGRGQQGPACRRSTSNVSAPRLAGGSTRADGS